MAVSATVGARPDSGWYVGNARRNLAISNPQRAP